MTYHRGGLVPAGTRAPDLDLAGEWRACRYCREPVIRGVPCPCDRAQAELARIRADTR